MKKRLFISSILMTLVLLVAITTATFAWYSAASGAGAVSSSTTGTLTAEGSAGTLGSLEFEFSFAGTGTSSAIKPVELTDDSGDTYVLNSSGTPMLATNQAELFKVETLTVTLTGIEYAGETVASANWGDYQGTYTITLKASGKAKLAKTEAAAKTASLEAEVSFTVIIASNGTVTYGTGDNLNVVYFGMDGTGSGNNAHISGAIAVKEGGVVKTA